VLDLDLVLVLVLVLDLVLVLVLVLDLVLLLVLVLVLVPCATRPAGAASFTPWTRRSSRTSCRSCSPTSG